MGIATKKHHKEARDKTVLQLTQEHLKDGETILLDIDENDLLETNSRCVSVDTTLPSPLGRRKKKSVTAKSEIIKFRCSLYEKKILKVKARKSGLTLSEYFRRVAFEKKITERLTEDEIVIYRTLVKFHNNFKSIGNMYRKRNPKLTDEVYRLADMIKTHLQKLSP